MVNIKLNPNRNYGIDFLRILSMLFVLLLHILQHGGILTNLEKFSLGYNLAWFVEVCAYCAVNCYALISGFIGYNSKQKYSNIINLYFQTAFYAILATSIFYTIIPDVVGEFAFVKAALPFAFDAYWYFKAYFCMFFFMPFMNKIIEVCDFKLLTKLVSLFVVFFSILPTILRYDIYSTDMGYSVLWISILYIIGGYIKKYELHKKISNFKCVLLYFGAVFVTFGQKVITEYVKFAVSGEVVNEGMFIKYVSPTIVICAVSLLCFFAKVDFKEGMKKFTTIISPFAFSVYLIHTAPFVSSKIMKNRFIAYADFNPIIMILVVFATAIGIFMLCSLIDFIRVQLFRLFRIKELSVKIEGTIANLIEKIYNKKEIEKVK